MITLSFLSLLGQVVISCDVASPVFTHGPQGAAPQLLGLDVVRLHPEHLQLGVVGLRELEALDDAVHLLEVALVEVDEGLGLQHRLVAVQQLARGQRPQKSEDGR